MEAGGGDFMRRFLKSRKYGNHKIQIGENTFDSRKEYIRYLDLLGMLNEGKITDLKRQVKYVLIPAQREPDEIGPRGGIHKGKLIEKEVSYYADFVYKLADSGITIVEDTKGMRTTEYVIKRKMMLYFHGIRIKEI